MALSVVDLYATVLPKTNCRDCGFQTCLAFAGMVVSEKLPLSNCPHIPKDRLSTAQAELDQQYREGRWLRKDMAEEALVLARDKAASMALADIAARLKGDFSSENGIETIRLPYFNTAVRITGTSVSELNGRALTRNEQTFIYMHMAHGGNSSPSGEMKSLKEFPNTISKISSMKRHVEQPLQERFAYHVSELEQASLSIGGTDARASYTDPAVAFSFRAFPQVPVTLLFWDAEDGFDAEARLLFDRTITDHLDIESIMFLSETLCRLLIDHAGGK